MDEAQRQRVRELNDELEAAIENDRYTLDTNLIQARILLAVIRIGSVMVFSEGKLSKLSAEDRAEIEREIELYNGFTDGYPEMGERLFGQLDVYYDVVGNGIQKMKHGLVTEQLRALMNKEDKEVGP